MKKIKVNLGKRSYEIILNANILKNFAKYLTNLQIGKKILIVTQKKVPITIIRGVKNNLVRNNYQVFTLVLPSGERYKNFDVFMKIIHFALKNKLERNDSFLAIGGGVITDLTGFAASIYFRGINFLCIPTTLLAMTDAAIGGKTGINLKEGKNLIGTFYQPKIVIVDPCCIKTLPKREFLTGLGEVIKYSLIDSSVSKRPPRYAFFKYLKKNINKIKKLEINTLSKIIYHSIKVKAAIVSLDEKESGLRSILNLGHTFAHGIEQAYNYKKYTHGEAVGIGICLATRLAAKHKFINQNSAKEIISLVYNFGLPTKLENKKKINQIIKAMTLDKKIKDGKLRFILPFREIGKVKIFNNIKISEIKTLLTH